MTHQPALPLDPLLVHRKCGKQDGRTEIHKLRCHMIIIDHNMSAHIHTHMIVLYMIQDYHVWSTFQTVFYFIFFQFLHFTKPSFSTLTLTVPILISVSHVAMYYFVIIILCLHKITLICCWSGAATPPGIE